MRMSLFFVVSLSSMICLAEAGSVADETVPQSAAAEAVAKPVEGTRPVRPEVKRLTPEERQAMRERMRAERDAYEKAEAEKKGVSVEEYRRQREQARCVLREKRDRELAEREGVSLEEFRARREAKHDENVARRLGVTVEEYKKMTPDAIRARHQELRQKRQAELKAKREKDAAARTAASAKVPAGKGAAVSTSEAKCCCPVKADGEGKCVDTDGSK